MSIYRKTLLHQHLSKLDFNQWNWAYLLCYKELAYEIVGKLSKPEVHRAGSRQGKILNVLHPHGAKLKLVHRPSGRKSQEERAQWQTQLCFPVTELRRDSRPPSKGTALWRWSLTWKPRSVWLSADSREAASCCRWQSVQKPDTGQWKNQRLRSAQP